MQALCAAHGFGTRHPRGRSAMAGAALNASACPNLLLSAMRAFLDPLELR